MDDTGTYRAVALRLPELVRRCSARTRCGAACDDPNDIVPHEHRRDLRGLFVFAAWLNMAGFRAVSTQDVVVTVDGVPRIRHRSWISTKSLGSGLFEGEKLAFEGNERICPGLGAIGRNIASMGVVTPAWAKERTIPTCPMSARSAAPCSIRRRGGPWIRWRHFSTACRTTRSGRRGR